MFWPRRLSRIRSARKIATMLTASIDTNNFLTEAHAKLRPVESPTAGIFLSGVCQGPKDIPETVSQAGAAAVKGHRTACKGQTDDAIRAWRIRTRCCATAAPSVQMSARTARFPMKKSRSERLTVSAEVRRVAQVNTALCQGCGACTVTCPSGAMDLQGFSNRQIIAEVDAICR